MSREKISDFTRIETLLALQGQGQSANGGSIDTTQIPSQDSFRFLPPGSSIKSTQQLPVDWSDFSKHTFFSSAVANVNVAFDNIVNNFPFDGTFKEIEDYFDNLTGFELYTYNLFPRSLNSLTFKNGSYISVTDAAGSKFPELSRNTTGASVLDPGGSSISFQFKIFVPPTANDNQIIAQRVLANTGYTIALSSSASPASSSIEFFYLSGSSYLSSSATIQKNQWNDIAAVFNRRPGINKLQLFVSGNLIHSSDSISELSVFTSTTSQLLIGSGTRQTTTGFDFLPVQTLSASLDDFKIFIGNRTPDEINFASKNPVEPSQSLKLFFKFNEPSGSYDRNMFIIDSSGNGLHSTITNFSMGLRDSNANSGGPAYFSERPKYNPVLFPDYADLSTLNQEMLSEAADYDANNPNLILKLVPSHYLEEEQSDKGFQTVDGNIGRSFSEGGDLPRATSLGSVQLITSMLLIWAKQFDELKMFIDQFSKLDTVNYDSQGGIADTFLPFLAKQYGIELPRIFTNSTYAQYIHGDNLTENNSIGVNPLYTLEAELWRRILVNVPHIIKSKGTIDSIKSIIRSVGIDPDVTLRFKEFGGAKSGYISGRKTIKKNIDFTNTDEFLLTSPYLSSSRIEPGLPTIDPSLEEDFLTVENFTFESHFKRVPDSKNVIEDQSLVRFLSTGSAGQCLLLNLILKQSGSVPGSKGNLILSGAYSTDVSLRNEFKVEIENVPTFDGNPFYVSFGREKNDNISKWYLRFGKSQGQTYIFKEETHSISLSNLTDDCFSKYDSSFNTNGTFFQIGNSSSIADISSNVFLNNNGGTDTIARLTTSKMQVTQIRFWSKHLTGNEWKEHVKNPFSLGVTNPVNFNFTSEISGSFERLRIDASVNQEITSSDGSGNITIKDFSQNNFDLTGTGFTADAEVISPFEIVYQTIDHHFDESSDDLKVRVRSWQNSENASVYGGESNPVYQVDPSEVPIDDNRFGIEISAVRALNEDIILMFGGHEPLDNLFGNPADMFSVDYSAQQFHREIYFNRITQNLSFKNVMLFSKWFESNIERLIEQFIPFNTDFSGINFVIENHVLERNKIRYGWGDNYLGDTSRNTDNVVDETNPNSWLTS